MILRVIIIGALILTSCNNSENAANEGSIAEDKELILNYYDAYNAYDIKMINQVISDDFKLYDSGTLILGSKEEYIDIVAWGRELSAHNQIDSIYFQNGNWHVDQTETSERIRFLYGRDVKSEVKFTIDDGTIVRIDLSLIDIDTDMASDRIKKFLRWVSDHHPELMDRIYGFNKESAIAYKQAMKLYRESKKQNSDTGRSVD